MLTLYETGDLGEACTRLRADCALAAVTRGEQGSLILTPGEIIEIEVEPVARAVDTTGAGDLYAAGFLFGLARGLELRICGALASIAAAEIISHIGPRPETSLAGLARARNLI